MAKITNISDAKAKVPTTPAVVDEPPKDVLDKGKVSTVKKLYKETETALRKTYEKMRDLGVALIDLREDVKHGSFMKVCTEDLGLNYKACQRAMLIANYRPQIEAQVEGEPEDASAALRIANKLKKEEDEARAKREELLFIEHREAVQGYEAETADITNATDLAKVPKPSYPWNDIQDPTERRNVTNRFKAWKKREEAKENAGAETKVPEATLEEVVDAAYQSAMLKLDGLSAEDLGTGLALLIERLSSLGEDEFPETPDIEDEDLEDIE